MRSRSVEGSRDACSRRAPRDESPLNSDWQTSAIPMICPVVLSLWSVFERCRLSSLNGGTQLAIVYGLGAYSHLVTPKVQHRLRACERVAFAEQVVDRTGRHPVTERLGDHASGNQILEGVEPMRRTSTLVLLEKRSREGPTYRSRGN